LALLQPITDIAAVCALKGVKRFVLSPGSRCAPLTIALVRHPDIDTRSVSDERSAAFIALGMAQATQEAIGLVCTSGTAVLNYAPAVTEAYYQQVPLLVLSADRPPEWIEQQDGQTIQQYNAFGPHVKKSYQLPADYSHLDAQWHINRIINEAINLAQAEPRGPVHINIPLREPFYPAAGEELQFSPSPRLITEYTAAAHLPAELIKKLGSALPSSGRTLVVAGQHVYDSSLLEKLGEFSEALAVPVISDVISNTSSLKNSIALQDALLMQKGADFKESLQPDLLITFGNSVISKNLKLFLRAYAPAHHWHIQEAGTVADAFQSVTHILRAEPATFFEELSIQLAATNTKAEPLYLNKWLAADRTAKQTLDSFMADAPFGEWKAMQQVMQNLPAGSALHLGNSMPVRYANFLGLNQQNPSSVWANRGTSGIDGSNSTALGFALCSTNIVTLFTGDVAFFYDRNAFWHTFMPANLRVVVFNNGGGGIFRMIDGPAAQPELKEYFETVQLLSAERTAQDAGMEYVAVTTEEELTASLQHFFSASPKAKLLEIFSASELNASVFRKFKELMASAE
jgi:2-succinyl-5-enolpyruvyl-6-hydroxy-3-cyclohexene-1-carboxylate synthase